MQPALHTRFIKSRSPAQKRARYWLSGMERAGGSRSNHRGASQAVRSNSCPESRSFFYPSSLYRVLSWRRTRRRTRLRTLGRRGSRPRTRPTRPPTGNRPHQRRRNIRKERTRTATVRPISRGTRAMVRPTGLPPRREPECNRRTRAQRRVRRTTRHPNRVRRNRRLRRPLRSRSGMVRVALVDFRRELGSCELKVKEGRGGFMGNRPPGLLSVVYCWSVPAVLTTLAVSAGAGVAGRPAKKLCTKRLR